MKRAGQIAGQLLVNEKDSRTRKTVETLILLCNTLADRIASGELTASWDTAEEEVHCLYRFAIQCSIMFLMLVR